ncbi:uncharacterized protein LOC103658632 [Ursus maritimus]|uniref:Uncharacterized protein LOC103658632 n=1 Tax=Ursus maritimus TaxID=29073 RepID=A0A384BQF9_URSMA|nr:uncharacterized protein LOC103658632 [Ursus maritimus]
MRALAAPPEAPPPCQTVSPTSAQVFHPPVLKFVPRFAADHSRARHLGFRFPAQPDFRLNPKSRFPLPYLPASLRWLAACSIFIRLRLTSLSVPPPSLTEDGGVPQGLWPARPALILPGPSLTQEVLLKKETHLMDIQGVVLMPKALAQAARPRDKNSSLGLPEESKSWLQTRGPAFTTGFYFMPWDASGWAEGQGCCPPPTPVLT